MTLGFRGLEDDNPGRSVDGGGILGLGGFPGWRLVGSAVISSDRTVADRQLYRFGACRLQPWNNIMRLMVLVGAGSVWMVVDDGKTSALRAGGEACSCRWGRTRLIIDGITG